MRIPMLVAFVAAIATGQAQAHDCRTLPEQAFDTTVLAQTGAAVWIATPGLPTHRPVVLRAVRVPKAARSAARDAMGRALAANGNRVHLQAWGCEAGDWGATVTAGSADLAAILLRAGAAYATEAATAEHRNAEAEARRERRGVWGIEGPAQHR